ncbi:hypothetical protein KUTeg_004567 [Tegillarca granosa]|uniref:Uncharacterized protein n=1 Tax=Tegillarca granosa TaxID=220873 RepID=A0ABQ9FQB6_TEGGR|nr:hypothetical protein KUTeg_004567 [Tegillarca granosa]
MESTIQYIDSVIDVFNGSIVLSCWRDGINHQYSLPKYTCVEGRVVNCNPDFCHGRGMNDICCAAQKFISEGRKIAAETLKTTSVPVIAGDNDCKETLFISITVTLSIILAVLFALMFFKRNPDLFPCKQGLCFLEQKKSKDNNRGLAMATNNSGLAMATYNSSELMNSSGSLNKRKIHGPPVVVESQINMDEDHAHQLYLRDENRAAPQEEDGDETQALTV